MPSLLDDTLPQQPPDDGLAQAYRAVSDYMARQQNGDPYQAALSNSRGLLDVPPPAGSMFDRSPQTAAGLLDPGNINIHQRPVVKNADGSVSTVRSMTFTDDDGSTVVVPSVIARRGIVGPEEAFKHYQRTGQHLGRFDNADNADRYARMLHEAQAQEYLR